MFELYLPFIQVESDMTFWSGVIGVLVWFVYMLFAAPAAAEKKRKQDEAYAERKGISIEQLYQKRRNTADRKINATTKRMVFEKYNYQCNYCGDIDDLHIDHIFPFSKYRDNSFENLQILCRDCNLKKGDSEPDPKLHPELFGENAKGSMVRKYQSVEAFKDENLTPEQIKALKEIEDTFTNLGDNS